MKVILIRSCALCLILAPMLAGAAEAAGNRDERYEAYRKIWDRAREQIDLRELERLVEGLDRAGVARQRNLDALRERTNLSFSREMERHHVNKARRPAAQKAHWERYLKHLKKAVEEEAPKVFSRSPMPRRRGEMRIRGRAIVSLGSLAPHPAFVPLLRAIVSNEDEPTRLRVGALTAISKTPHPELVPYLTAQLTADEPNIANRAAEQLLKLTGPVIQGNPEDLLSAQRMYEAWWRRHKDDFEYDREALKVEY